MLERVSPTAECAAHTFLRQFEAPVRSQRYLGSSFWKHGSGCMDTPAWWPLYLEGVRTRNENISRRPQFRSVNLPVPVTQRHRKSAQVQCLTRTFSGSLPHNQVLPVQKAAEEDDDFQEYKTTDFSTHLHGSRREMIADRARAHSNTPGTDSSSRTTQISLESDWDAFIRTGCDEREAAVWLHRFATSDTDKELDHALQAFSFIPQAFRTSQDYDAAVDVAIRMDRFSIAIQVIKEAISRNRSEDTFVKFLSLCVSKNLWNVAADIWNEIGISTKSRTIFEIRHSISGRQNFAGRHISYFDQVRDLPSRLVILAGRLASNDPVLVHRKSSLMDLCKALALLAVENDKVISIITAKGLLELFALQQRLNLDTNLHWPALATINRLPDKGTKAQLAIVIYKNFRSIHADGFIPKWVFGTMVAICAAGKYPPKTYRSLLKDYRSVYNRSDDAMYLQVLKACANQGEVDDLYTVFAELYQYSPPRSGDEVNPLIRVHAVTGDYKNAQLQFNRIEDEFGLTPSVRNWNSLLLAFNRSNHPERAYDIFNKMQQNGCRPDQYSWSIMVAVAGQTGDTKYARKLVRQAIVAGIAPPLAMTGAVVDSYLMNKQPDDAWPLVIEGTKAWQGTSESPVRLWNSLFRYYAFKADSEAILHTQERMKEFGVKADAMTYAALMTALVVQGRTQDAARVLRTLHFSQALSANEFHYSILIHGFAMEKNTEAASAIYNEMLKRFPRATPSAKLSMLYAKAARAEERASSAYLSGQSHLKPDFRSLFKSFSDVLEDMKQSDLASTVPNPGFKRKVSRNDMGNVYFGSLITFLQRNNAHGPSQKIMELLKATQHGEPLSMTNAGSSWTSLLDSISQELENSIHAQDWTSVSNHWNAIVAIVIKHCVTVDDSSSGTAKIVKPSNTHNIELTGVQGPQFSSMIPRTFPDISSQGSYMQVAPAYQYLLSRHISQYIQALDKQLKYTEVIETVQTLLKYGFKLSSRNWNGLIQALCRSPSPDHRTLAFQLFEKHLLPNAPSWNTIRRGKWIQPSEERPRSKWDTIKSKTDKRVSRKMLEKLDPSQLMPTYYTIIHLAIVWSKASRSSVQGYYASKRLLESQTPGTVKLVLRTPYLRDRVQGVLLRGRQVIGDRMKRPRQALAEPDFSGVQDSQLLIDHIPPDILEELQGTAGPGDDLNALHSSTAEKTAGQIPESNIVLASQGRHESLFERRKRLVRERRRKVKQFQLVLQQLRQDSLASAPLVATSTRGQPAIGPLEITAATQDTGSVQQPQRVQSNLNNVDAGLPQFGGASPTFHQQRSVILRNIRGILRRVKNEALYQPSALAAGRQKSSIRTTSLTQRQGVQLILRDSVATIRRNIRPRGGSKPRPRFNGAHIKEDAPKLASLKRKRNHFVKRSHIIHLRGLSKHYSVRYESLRAQILRRGLTSKKAKEYLRRYQSKAETVLTKWIAYKKQAYQSRSQ